MRRLVEASRVRILRLSVAGPGGLVESRPELHTELVMTTRGCSWIPLATRRLIPSWRSPHRTPPSRPGRTRLPSPLDFPHSYVVGSRTNRPASVEGNEKFTIGRAAATAALVVTAVRRRAARDVGEEPPAGPLTRQAPRASGAPRSPMSPPGAAKRAASTAVEVGRCARRLPPTAPPGYELERPETAVRRGPVGAASASPPWKVGFIEVPSLQDGARSTGAQRIGERAGRRRPRRAGRRQHRRAEPDRR